MRFPFLVNPETGKPDEFTTISIMITTAVVCRFLLDGSSFTLYHHIFTFSKLDAVTYASLLTPALGAHCYVRVNK